MEKIRFNWIDKNLMKQMDIASNIQKILEFSYLRLPRTEKAYANYFSEAKQVGLKYFCDYRILVVSF